MSQVRPRVETAWIENRSQLRSPMLHLCVYTAEQYLHPLKTSTSIRTQAKELLFQTGSHRIPRAPRHKESGRPVNPLGPIFYVVRGTENLTTVVFARERLSLAVQNLAIPAFHFSSRPVWKIFVE